MLGGEALYEQLVRIEKSPPDWDKLPMPVKALYEALAELKRAFVHHTQVANAHPPATKTGP